MNIKRSKINDLKRLVKEFNVENIFNDIKLKIENLETKEEANKWDSVAYILKYKKENEVNILKESKIKEIKKEVSNIIQNKFGGYYNQLNILNKLGKYTLEDKTKYLEYTNNILKQEKILFDEIKNINNIPDLNNYKFTIKE